MRQNPSCVLGERDEIRRLIRENSWAPRVSHASKGELVDEGCSANQALANEMRREHDRLTRDRATHDRLGS